MLEPMPHDRRPLILIPLVALVVVAPMILQGCSCGHDFDFHVINWFEAARQITHGTLYPHWTFTPAWNAGEPRFVFYPPLSWFMGALLGLVMPWTWTPIVYTWIALTAAGLGLFYAARPFSSANAATIAAAIYLANPYTLYTAYERTAYAELLAAAWLPLALSAMLRDRISIPRVAIPVALLWLTNAPAAVMGCYALAVLALLRLLLPGSRPTTQPISRVRIALNSLAGVLLGLGLASFYLVPAAYERRYVQIGYAILPGLLPEDNFLFHHTSDPQHDIVLHYASIVALVIIAMTAIALLPIGREASKQISGNATNIPQQGTDDDKQPLRNLEQRPSDPKLYLALLAALLVLMLTPLSLLLWRYLPELRFLQFPWRLLAVLAAVFGLALARTLSRLRLQRVPAFAATALALLILTWTGDSFFRQYCYPEDTIPERLAIFQSPNPGTDPTDEYTPVGADNDAANQSNPGYWLAQSATDPAPSGSTPSPAPHRLDLSPTAPTTLILNLRSYPAWRILRSDSPVSTRLPRKDGLVAIPLPAGPAHIEISYITLADQRIGDLLSLLAAVVLLALLFRRRARVAL